LNFKVKRVSIFIPIAKVMVTIVWNSLLKKPALQKNCCLRIRKLKRKQQKTYVVTNIKLQKAATYREVANLMSKRSCYQVFNEKSSGAVNWKAS